MGSKSDPSQPPLSFFQKYFTRPADTTRDSEKHVKQGRRFSFASLGFIVAAVMVLVILCAVISAAVALTIDRQHKIEESKHYGPFIRKAIQANFPDPTILHHDDGTWYAFATNNAAGVLKYHNHSLAPSNASLHTLNYGKANVQMATSDDFVNWNVASLKNQPLPTTGKWTERHLPGKSLYPRISTTWAPSVIRRDDGKYVLYYSATTGGRNPTPKHPHPHCIGAAVSKDTSPAGPYEALDESLACPVMEGGAIDPQAFRDVDGSLYLAYKVDGNNIGRGGECGNLPKKHGEILYDEIRPTPILLQRMDADGITKDGNPIEILTNDPSDGALIEAPMIVRSSEGIYFLFYSSGCTRFPSYTTKYATSESVMGPYIRANSSLLKTGDWGLEAPGSIGLALDKDGGWNMAFHARVPDGDIGRIRAMFTTKLQLNGTRAHLWRHNSSSVVRSG